MPSMSTQTSPKAKNLTASAIVCLSPPVPVHPDGAKRKRVFVLDRKEKPILYMIGKG